MLTSHPASYVYVYIIVCQRSNLLLIRPACRTNMHTRNYTRRHRHRAHAGIQIMGLSPYLAMAATHARVNTRLIVTHGLTPICTGYHPYQRATTRLVICTTGIPLCDAITARAGIHYMGYHPSMGYHPYTVRQGLTPLARGLPPISHVRVNTHISELSLT